MNRIAIIMLAGVSGFAASASAQNALGDGRGMQKNTNKYDSSLGPTNKGFDYRAAKMRDAIVFGAIPNGYALQTRTLQDSSQFMGVLPSNTLYDFRRDSYNSGLAGQGIRGTDALQYQFALTNGGAPRSDLSGTLYLDRYGNSSGGAVANGAASIRPIVPVSASKWKTDDLQTGGALRATSSFVTSSMLKPAIVGERMDANGVSRSVSASPMLGLQLMDRDVSSPLNATARMDTSAQAKPAETADPRSAAAGGPETEAERKARETSKTSYDELVQRLTTKGAARDEAGADKDKKDAKAGEDDSLVDENGKVSAKPKWMRDIESLKKKLNGPDDKEPAEKRPSTQGQPAVPGAPAAPPGMRFDSSGKLVPLMDDSTTALIRDAGTSGARFIKPIKDDRDPFVTEMQAGEKLFAKSQFFLAEEKFARALSLRPGDTSAMTARAHAQLAGGMYQSAANNLRQLFTDHPEVAAMRYARDLLPSDERNQILAKDLDDRIATNPKMLGATGLKATRDAGFLRAYLGYQLGDKAAVDRGINTMLTSFDGRDEPTLNEQALAIFLRGVWLGISPGGEPKAETPAK